MKKLKGFTLTDVIVTMIISLLITGIAFSVFRMTYNQLFNYQKDNSENQKLILLHMMLQNDFQQSEMIRCNANTIKFESSFGKSCEYTITDESIIRHFDSVKDSFPFLITDVSTLCKKSKIDNGVIDELSFTIEVKKIKYPYKFVKSYPSELETYNE